MKIEVNLPDDFSIEDVEQMARAIYDYCEFDSYLFNAGGRHIDALIALATALGHDGQDHRTQDMASLRDELFDFSRVDSREVLVNFIDEWADNENAEAIVGRMTDEQVSGWVKRIDAAEGADWYDACCNIVEGLSMHLPPFDQHVIAVDLLDKWGRGTLKEFLELCPLSLIDIFLFCAETQSMPTLRDYITRYKENRLDD